MWFLGHATTAGSKTHRSNDEYLLRWSRGGRFPAEREHREPNGLPEEDRQANSDQGYLHAHDPDRKPHQLKHGCGLAERQPRCDDESDVVVLVDVDRRDQRPQDADRECEVPTAPLPPYRGKRHRCECGLARDQRGVWPKWSCERC